MNKDMNDIFTSFERFFGEKTTTTNNNYGMFLNESN